MYTTQGEFLIDILQDTAALMKSLALLAKATSISCVISHLHNIFDRLLLHITHFRVLQVATSPPYPDEVGGTASDLTTNDLEKVGTSLIFQCSLSDENC